MTGKKRINRQLIGGLVFMMMMTLGIVAGAAAEPPSRYDVLFSDMLEQMELEARIMDINLAEGYLIAGEQVILLVEADEAQPPVNRTIVYDRAGNVLQAQALKMRQRVLIRGLAHPSGQIVAVEIHLVKQSRREQRHRKTNG